MDATRLAERTPRLGAERAADAAARLWGFDASASELPSERDRNFLLTGNDGRRRVLKVARRGEDRALLEAQNALVERLVAAGNAGAAARYGFPRPLPSRAGRTIETVEVDSGTHLTRLVEWVPGTPLAELADPPPRLLGGVGRLMGTVGRILAAAGASGRPDLAALDRPFYWDLRGGAALVREHLDRLPAARRGLVERRAAAADAVVGPRADSLRIAPIHGDGNDWNVLVAAHGHGHGDAAGEPRVTGLLDFGDAVASWVAAEPAIAAAYALLGRDDLVEAAAAVVAGYHAEHPLTLPERECVWTLTGLRLAMSVTIAAIQRAQRPDDAYLSVTEKAAWEALERMEGIDDEAARERMVRAAFPPGGAGAGSGDPGPTASAAPARGPTPGTDPDTPDDPDAADLLARRRASIGPSLSISYRRPLHIVRGWMQHLYDAEGHEYLDCVNNVAHVGHGHPRVVDALARQAAALNTNTRYLHENLVRYADALAARLPDPLEVCYFVNSGSEANELALRLARAYTGRRDAVVLDTAYHGNTSAAVDLSPYKFDGPGGAGAPEWVHVAPLPDPYRGRHRAPGDDPHVRDTARPDPSPELAARYVAELEAVLARTQANGGPAALFAESLASCGGQVEYPAPFLAGAYAAVRAAGGVAVADEVQVGFGRVGTHFWGFETHGPDAVPDIVTLGKPIGNGHPLGAVVTTRAIAEAFDNGMEYFNTFGGNPVSCAVGLAVLDVIDDEALQTRAARVGARLELQLRMLARDHPSVGDVRGRGLFLGVELVTDRAARSPATALAREVVEAMRSRGILLSTDGPDANVIKIKPPLQFSDHDADRVATELDAVLAELA
jgi:4-aminobutyrate aminotransferase-like enzyme/Ser/Thr protein kinase RdoA (MazF antagonist)